jgi:hypothetical protein
MNVTRYVALSHCWGTKQSSNPPLTTDKAKLASHLHRIQMAYLSKTFQDAVVLTKLCGVRYLWVDSLCIVQDDGIEWKIEAAKMGAIYYNAYLTLSAIDSIDSHGGLYLDVKRSTLNVSTKTWRPYLSSRPTRSTTSTVICRQVHHGRDSLCDNGPLKKRGWILQESLLSRRILYCGRDQFNWQCNCYSTTEDGGKFRSPLLDRIVLTRDSIPKHPIDLTKPDDFILLPVNIAHDESKICFDQSIRQD